MIDWKALNTDQHYLHFGVEATLRVDSWGEDIAVTVIDKTSGVAVSVSGDNEVQTIVPAAAMRVSDITDVGRTRADIDSGTIEFNGKCWKFEATLPKPTPAGEASGELFLILSETDD